MSLRIKYRDRPAVVVHRAAFKESKLVYVGRANRPYRYASGRSRIVYIGTTKKGARRVASSAARKGVDLLFEHGIKEVEFSVVTCSKLRAVATWRKLERALLIKFREKYGEVPRGNVQGKRMTGRPSLTGAWRRASSEGRAEDCTQARAAGFIAVPRERTDTVALGVRALPACWARNGLVIPPSVLCICNH